ncbi:epoxyqueuosine reductase QueH [bacterium]|nr:epoxyqueuosine reductase QueH [bacterium]
MMHDGKPAILLHACCAPCVTVPYRRLSENYRVDVFFYNPNIHPDPEYRFRHEEICRLGERWGFSVIPGEYEKELWFDMVKGLEHEPERGARCTVCFRMRLQKTAETAKERQYDGFTTTLTLSPLKNAGLINSIGREIGTQTGIPFIAGDFKKKDGFKQSMDISCSEDLYRQNYCGCIFSRKDDESS